MTELQRTVSTYELYERLIDRLGLALEIASTAVRLRNEAPVELELKGLSCAEFELIEAYLEKGTRAADGVVRDGQKGNFIAAAQQAGSMHAPRPSATIIWLKDKRRVKASTRSGRHS
ncbi:hypothetical protein KDX38_13735 [Pseudomonas sp. CDFA 602]|uniref:hypothetical protein n=1 Tax=Pseudomonas californiensis TaxID=2829823 RepID=UPI001E3327D7|nr:hypothetical protein [Pseudomonas californiensis]MCD5994742.1 hypothetical protein [Pseudomonas californiensis]MCD6000273.1 hypothetical protein [Pseudomonas californiensis]